MMNFSVLSTLLKILNISANSSNFECWNIESQPVPSLSTKFGAYFSMISV